MDITKLRGALAEALEQDPGDIKVLIAPTDYDRAVDLKLIATIFVGPPSEEAEERIDQLFEEVPERIAENRDLGGLIGDIGVASCSGHRVYGQKGGDPLMGAEWTFAIVGKD